MTPNIAASGQGTNTWRVVQRMLAAWCLVGRRYVFKDVIGRGSEVVDATWFMKQSCVELVVESALG